MMESLKDEGYDEGRLSGINERNIEIAKNLLSENIEINIISKTTGLSIDELNDIKDGI
jgi:predicted transposase/invertase (TIGR01784 family)